MTNQTIKNMGLIVAEFKNEVISSNGYESSKVLKTLINTYGTMLHELQCLSKTDFRNLKIEPELIEHGAVLSSSINEVESNLTPNLISKRDFKSVDNLSVVTSKVKRVIEYINELTRSYTFTRELEKNNTNLTNKLKQLDSEDSGTNATLHKKLNELYNERDVANVMCGGRAFSLPQYKELKYKIEALEELVKELA